MTGSFDKGKTTKRERFLAGMGQVVPWERLLALIEPPYPKANPVGGRPPLPPERMFRIYCLQQWYNLSDPIVDRQHDCRAIPCNKRHGALAAACGRIYPQWVHGVSIGESAFPIEMNAALQQA